MNKVIEDILAEYERQGEVFTPENVPANGALATAAAAFAIAGSGPQNYSTASTVFSLAGWGTRSFDPNTPRQNIVKACALLIREVERRDRLGPEPDICGNCGEAMPGGCGGLFLLSDGAACRFGT
jgi:hypothetical protein